jgi:hypothetical protein
MVPHSFKEAIIEMMTQIAKEIPDSHKKVPVKKPFETISFRLSYSSRISYTFCG